MSDFKFEIGSIDCGWLFGNLYDDLALLAATQKSNGGKHGPRR